MHGAPDYNRIRIAFRIAGAGDGIAHCHQRGPGHAGFGEDATVGTGLIAWD
jgi:hypothetical protein